MRTSLKLLIGLTLIVPCLSLFGADSYKSQSKIKMGGVKKSSPISTRLSYGSGCIVGDCDYGIGYYIYPDGDISLGKWNGQYMTGVGVETRKDYYIAANYLDGIPTFGFVSWYNGYDYMGNIAEMQDSFWYMDGVGFSIYNGVTQYGTFSAGDFVEDGCTIYYSSKLRQETRRILPTDEGVSTSSGSCKGICTNGIGKKTYSDGSYYIGDFANGMANGFGIYVQSAGEISAGKYIDNYLIEGYITDSDGGLAFNANYDIDSYLGEVWVYDSNGKFLGEYCNMQSGNTNTTPTVPANTSGIKQMVANKSFDVNGVFFQYGTGAFDWIYVEKSGSYAAKLAGANSDGFFDWDFIHTSDNPGFDYINVSSDGKSVKFGPLKGNVNLPGQ
jgi:hypothetical protein